MQFSYKHLLVVAMFDCRRVALCGVSQDAALPCPRPLHIVSILIMPYTAQWHSEQTPECCLVSGVVQAESAA